jgi:hypothetical protein
MSTMTSRPAARPGKSFGPSNSSRPSNAANAPKANQAPRAPDVSKKPAGEQPPAEHEILFQQFFKSVGPRTYVAQVKRANNGNHYVVLTEGKRDGKTQDVRKVRLFVFSEDFDEFFKLMNATAAFVRAHPVPKEVKAKRERFWAKQAAEAPRGPASGPGAAAR